MVRIAITGGIACGKSLVGQFLQSSGVAVRDADDIVHELFVPGEVVYREVVEAFGTGILTEGKIDRAVLGRLVFADGALRKRLTDIVHPEVRRRWEGWLNEVSRRGVRAAAAIIPLLYEGGYTQGWNAVICVAASQADQERRLVERGLSIEQAASRIRAQWPVWKKMTLSDYVIFNGGSKELLKEQTMRALTSILENAHV